MLRTFQEDIRFGVRLLTGNPGLSIAAIVTLAVGIAAAATVFSWTEALLLEPVPGARASGRLVALEILLPNGNYSTTSYRDYRDYRDRMTLVSGLGASLMNPFQVGPDESTRLVWGEFVSRGYFDVLDVEPALGRFFQGDENGDAPGGPRVAVISHRLWMRDFGGSRSALGRTLRVNRRDFTIVGVAPARFRGSVPGLGQEMWIPVSLGPELNGQREALLNARTERQMWITGRLKPGATIEQAQQEASACARRIAEENPATNQGVRAEVMPLWRSHHGANAVLLEPLRILMFACVVVLLIVGSNVANLQLARAASRQREFGIRLVMGAGGGRLTRQLLTESLVLSAAGAGLGILMTLWMQQALVWLLPPSELPVEVGRELTLGALAFVVFLAVGAAVVTGVAPVLFALRSNLNETLKGGRGMTAGSGLLRARRALVAAEVALASIALAGTGLLVRSFHNAGAIAPGMSTANVYMAKYYVATFCRNAEERRQFCLRMEDRLKSVPGVTEVAYSNYVPLEFGKPPVAPMEVEGYVPAPGETMRLNNSNISTGYLAALGIPVLEGRGFTAEDDREKAPVVIVNQEFARRYYGGASPVGRRLKLFGRWQTVVGLARDSKYASLTEAPAAHVYKPWRQANGGEFWLGFFVRASGPGAGLAAAIARKAGEVEPSAGATRVSSYRDIVSGSEYARRVAATLLTVVGAVTLLLAAVGIYGVLSFAVSLRTQEYGIRQALGAGPSEVMARVLREALGLAAMGVAAGMAGAAIAGRLASGFLVGVSPYDPLIFAGSALFLVLVAAAAGAVPALRAMRIAPHVALRDA